MTSEIKLSASDMRKMLTETSLPSSIAEVAGKIAAALPPKPKLPDGVPSDWQEALFTPGVCSIPLWSDGKWRFGAFLDGMPIQDNRANSIVMFDSYDEAMIQLQGYFEYMKKSVDIQ